MNNGVRTFDACVTANVFKGSVLFCPLPSPVFSICCKQNNKIYKKPSTLFYLQQFDSGLIYLQQFLTIKKEH